MVIFRKKKPGDSVGSIETSSQKGLQADEATTGNLNTNRSKSSKASTSAEQKTRRAEVRKMRFRDDSSRDSLVSAPKSVYSQKSVLSLNRKVSVGSQPASRGQTKSDDRKIISNKEKSEERDVTESKAKGHARRDQSDESSRDFSALKTEASDASRNLESITSPPVKLTTQERKKRLQNKKGRKRVNSDEGTLVSIHVIDDETESAGDSETVEDTKQNKTPRKRKDVRRIPRGRQRKGTLTEGSTRSFSEHSMKSFTESLKVMSVTSARSHGTNKLDRKANENLLRSKHKTACNFLRVGELYGARKEFEEIAALLISQHDESHHRVGAALHNIGIVHIRAGNYTDALDAIEEAVKIRKATLGRFHTKVADSLVELGITLLSMQEFDDSLDIFHEALDMRERESDKSDSDKSFLQVAKVLNNIGCVYFEAGDFDQAQSTFEEALELQRDVIDGEGTPSLLHPAALAMASTLSNIGSVCMEENDWDEAIIKLDEAAGIQQSVLEPGNKLLLSTLENLGYSKLMYKNYIGAIETYQEMLTIQEKSLGVLHIDCAKTRWKIVNAHLNLCEYDNAMSELGIIEKIQMAELGENHEKYIQTKELIGWLRYEELKYPSPIEILSRSMMNRGLRNPFTDRLCCACNKQNTSEVDLASLCEIPGPDTSSKMSGHKVSFA